MNEFKIKVKLVWLGSGSGPESPSTDDLAQYHKPNHAAGSTWTVDKRQNIL